MKGVVLAGGLGTRCLPLTQNDNKHLLPVYNKRMVEYPINSLVKAGVKDIVLVTGGLYAGRFLDFLKNGWSFGIEHLFYAYQEGEGGIADALRLARNFVSPKEKVVVILGDNYFELPITSYIQRFAQQEKGAMALLCKTDRPQDFGIAEVDYDNWKILSIEEKPMVPKSNLAIVGCYGFDGQVWDIINTLKPSRRGELEIADVLEHYRQKDELRFSQYPGFWSDMGSVESIQTVSNRIIEVQRKISNA